MLDLALAFLVLDGLFLGYRAGVHLELAINLRRRLREMNPAV